MKRRLARLANAKEVIAVGQFERALNVEVDGSMSWSGEVHVVVAGASKKELRAAFSINPRFRRDPQEKLVQVKEVKGLGRALGYGDSLFRRRGHVPADERGRAEIRSAGEQKGNIECLTRFLLCLTTNS